MPLARAVYLETTVLWGVAHRKDDPSLQALSRNASDLGVPLYTTNLVVEELAQRMKIELLESQKNLQSAIDSFGRRRLVRPQVTWPQPFDDMLARLPQTARENLKSYGIVVLPNHPVDQERLENGRWEETAFRGKKARRVSRIASFS
jgi:hypothetical protein